MEAKAGWFWEFTNSPEYIIINRKYMVIRNVNEKIKAKFIEYYFFIYNIHGLLRDDSFCYMIKDKVNFKYTLIQIAKLTLFTKPNNMGKGYIALVSWSSSSISTVELCNICSYFINKFFWNCPDKPLHKQYLLGQAVIVMSLDWIKCEVSSHFFQ